MDYKSESKLISLLIKLMSPGDSVFPQNILNLRIVYKVIFLLRSMDWDSQPKSEFMSLTTQMVSLFSTMDMDSLPKPLSKLISFFSGQIRTGRAFMPGRLQPMSPGLDSLLRETLDIKPEPEFLSLIHQILSIVLSMSSMREKRVSLCPQASVILEEGKFYVHTLSLRSNKKWECFPFNWRKLKLPGRRGGDVTYFHCRNCNGANHQEYNKAPVEIKHTLHRKHSLHLVLCESSTTRQCYCCDEDLKKLFYYCSACDFAINLACLKEQQVLLTVDHPKWHEHTLSLFPRIALTCDVCGLTHSSCPCYTCPPCNFVIHRSCINLPRVIRISRHPHRIAFTHSFGVQDWSCGVCRKKIDTDYGGYCCIKEGCSYGAHSKCATQSNVWDGEELEGIPEETEEVIEPFVIISDGIIQHFLHQYHHLRLDKNTCRDYDENRLCEACVTPIYFGNFYSCMKCDFILHEECANLSRKIHHPIHPHKLTLVRGHYRFLDYLDDRCSACSHVCKTGFFYKCSKEGCCFQLQVQCAMISEPLVHESHMHPLYLTSKPGEKSRGCSICKSVRETFNCIDCDFSLCFSCATLPNKVRYKHDKHTLTLVYGNVTSIMTSWCEICEEKINPKERFYMCDEYCCVTLHIQCLLGSHLYMEPGSSWKYVTPRDPLVVWLNNHMSRPFCSYCANRCRDKIVFKCYRSKFCSMECAFLDKK